MRRREIPGSWGDRIARNLYNLNTFCLNWLEYEGNWDMPVLKSCFEVPERLFPFDERNKWKPGEGAIHFYCEDCEFESVWLRANQQPHMPAVVQKAGVCLTPDFSLYSDYPLATQIWNIYRARLLGALWQSQGIQVIPSVAWSGEASLEFCFDGLPTGGTVAIATSYWRKGDEAMFFAGLNELLQRVQPDTLLVYGRGYKGVIEAHHPNVKRYDSRLTEIFNEKARKKVA